MTAATNTVFVGKVLRLLRSVDSTNAEAARLLASNPRPIDGTAILADFQTAGRGQMGASWQSLAGQNLLASFIFYPKFLAAADQWRLSEAVALAVFEVVAEHFGAKTAIKWPNDVLVDGRKIAGVLIQNSLAGPSISASVVGIGINLNQPFFEEKTARPATSFWIEKGQPVDRQLIFEKLCKLLEINWLALKSGSRDLHGEYLERLYFFRKEATFQRPGGGLFSAQIFDVERGSGRLVLKSDAGLETFETKEIRLLD